MLCTEGEATLPTSIRGTRSGLRDTEGNQTHPLDKEPTQLQTSCKQERQMQLNRAKTDQTERGSQEQEGEGGTAEDATPAPRPDAGSARSQPPQRRTAVKEVGGRPRPGGGEAAVAGSGRYCQVQLKTTRNDGKASGGREARKYASPCFLGTKGGRLDGSEKLG
jgi:hypothetical protein